MPNAKKRKTESQKSRQRARTHKNLILKYEKFIKENPRHKDRKIWESKILELKGL
jgi:hypothetical protein